jgi:predicted nucleic acid-binding protein
MRVYLDSSALLKRAFAETGSGELEDRLLYYSSAGAVLVSSALAWIEVSRGIRGRSDAETPATITEVMDATMSGIAESPMSQQVVSLARRIGPPVLRSLDAIHLATATLIDADVIVAYDKRLSSVASELGFRVESPG